MLPEVRSRFSNADLTKKLPPGSRCQLASFASFDDRGDVVRLEASTRAQRVEQSTSASECSPSAA